MKKFLIVILILLLTTQSTHATLSFIDEDNKQIDTIVKIDDYDPLVDLSVTVTINTIRSLQKIDKQIPTIEQIDIDGNPDFFVKIFINDEEFTSPIWYNQKYIYDPQWSATLNVPDDKETVDITIQLWDWDKKGNKLCDISPFNYEFPDSYDVSLRYSIKTGHWIGDDYYINNPNYFDLSGYGRLNGCDDGSIYIKDRDCELWFDISQNDYDGDGIPYWTEVNKFNTDPAIDDRGRDDDSDGIPIEWEYKWGHDYGWGNDHQWFYDPFIWDNHNTLDPDGDGLNNTVEYQMSKWGTDPFRKDIFVELDIMESDPDGTVPKFSTQSEELLYTAFNRQNVVLHFDTGTMGGSDIIPFDEKTNHGELDEIYHEYFLNGRENNSKGGVFHYGVMVHEANGASGYIFRPDAFQISYQGMLNKKDQFPWLNLDVVIASAYMHELGHTFGFYPIPGHSEDCYYPWQLGFWLVRSYKSCMNYGYMYYTVDYSDGSRGKNDFDDWERMDMTYFQRYWI